MWPSPVPITLGTFAVLTIGAAYGPRLGLVTILGYMLIGALGFDVFAGSSAESNGLACMLGGTGGYLLGYVLATVALGLAARRGWDRTVAGMALACLLVIASPLRSLRVLSAETATEDATGASNREPEGVS